MELQWARPAAALVPGAGAASPDTNGAADLHAGIGALDFDEARTIRSA